MSNFVSVFKDKKPRSKVNNDHPIIMSARMWNRKGKTEWYLEIKLWREYALKIGLDHDEIYDFLVDAENRCVQLVAADSGRKLLCLAKNLCLCRFAFPSVLPLPKEPGDIGIENIELVKYGIQFKMNYETK